MPQLPIALPPGGHTGMHHRSTSPSGLSPMQLRSASRLQAGGVPSGNVSPNRQRPTAQQQWPQPQQVSRFTGQRLPRNTEGPFQRDRAQAGAAPGTGMPAAAAAGAALSPACRLVPKVFAPGSAAPGCSVPPRPMTEGEVTIIGGRRFLLGQVIGAGAYAQVWSARALNEQNEEQEDVAIKEMCCGSGPGILPDATIERATFEIQVMVQLGAGSDRRFEQVAAPRHLEHQFWPLGPHAKDALVCRVAMERRPGVPLVSWLAARSEKGCAAVAAAPPGNEIDWYCRSFLSSVGAARAMLAQLCPTFERMNREIAFHRDVNARNLLVHAPSDSDPSVQVSGGAPANPSELIFSVVDFGSSTCARAWFGGAEGSWQKLNPTGDARYWGPSSWLRFLGGLHSLTSEPMLARQYSHRLDMYALAICALETIATLHVAPIPSEAALRALAESRSAEVHLVQSVQRMRHSWSTYWSQSLDSFEKLGEYSKCMCNGDKVGADQKWQELSRAGIPQNLAQRLRELCDDFVSLGEVCRVQGGTSASSWGQAGDILDALREMVHESSSLDWGELCRRLGQAPVSWGRREHSRSVSPARTPTPPLETPSFPQPQRFLPVHPLSKASPGGQLQRDDESCSPAACSPSKVRFGDLAIDGLPPQGPVLLLGHEAGVDRAASAAAAVVEAIAASPTGAGAQSIGAAAALSLLPAGTAAPELPQGLDAVGMHSPVLRLPHGAIGAEVPLGDSIPEHWESIDASLVAQSNRLMRLPDVASIGTEEERGAQLEAMRILRQVELEVRNLKGWYSAAISAIKETEKFMATKAPEASASVNTVGSYVALEAESCQVEAAVRA